MLSLYVIMWVLKYTFLMRTSVRFLLAKHLPCYKSVLCVHFNVALYSCPASLHTCCCAVFPSQDVDFDDASSGCSSLSARTQSSAMSVGATSSGSYRSRTLPRPSSSRGHTTGGGGGGVEEEDFLKAFVDTPAVTVSVE